MKKINKIKTLLFALMLLITLSLPLEAFAKSEPLIKVKEGYTELGVFYEIYDNYNTSLTRSVISNTVSRLVVYYGIVNPPDSIVWTERLDSYTTLSGRLTRTSTYWDYKNNRTEVWYHGVIVGRV